MQKQRTAEGKNLFLKFIQFHLVHYKIHTRQLLQKIADAAE